MIEQQRENAWYPIAYASRSLTEAEKNYSPIESECLSIVFGCERFNEYVYGRKFTIQNDHQPLKAIFSKSITKYPPRIQRFFLRLQRYDFILEYSPGKTMKVVDALSTASLEDNNPEITSPDIQYHVYPIINALPISDQKVRKLQTETTKDDTLQKLKKYVLEGWPPKKKIDVSIAPYSSYREELSCHDGLLLKGSRIIVPYTLRSEIKSAIHMGHPGIQKSINRARSSVFWPNITKDITDYITNCSTCLNHRNTLQRETMIAHDIPDSPWIKVGIDLFSLYSYTI